jgi:hypothetical protein
MRTLKKREKNRYNYATMDEIRFQIIVTNEIYQDI